MKSAFRLLTLANEQRRYLRTLYRQAVVGVDRLDLVELLADLAPGDFPIVTSSHQS